MLRLAVRAPAKINLSLDVVGRRADGYHLLSTVMQSLELTDLVTVGLNPANAGICLTCNRRNLPLDNRNTAWKAARLFLDAIGVTDGVAINLTKNIPAAAGLAGGSADAAAVLYALDRLYPDRITRDALFTLAARVGADVPFCLHGGTVLCEGIGELLTPLPSFAGIPVLLCKPDFGLSTPWVFSHLDLKHLGRRPDQPAVLESLRQADLAALASVTANVLESVSLPAYPVLQILKSELAAAGASLTLMSGSGPTVFGLFSDAAACEAARKRLASRVPAGTLVLSTRTSASGPGIVT